MQRKRRTTPQATVICLIRHGTTPTTGKVLPGRARGLHLADKGSEEARRTAERLSGFEVDAVYSSPLERAKETAAPIAAALGHRVAVDKGLVECDFGEWTGRNLSELSRLPEWKTVQHCPSEFRFPGGESFIEMQNRIQETVLKLCERHRGKAVVAVSHADCIKALAALALGVPLDLFQRIVIGPCSTTVVAYGAGGPAMLTMNSYGEPSGLSPRRGTKN